MKKILIIEDEKYCAEYLVQLLIEIDETFDIHGPLESAQEVIKELSANNNYDLIISDIQLKNSNVFDAFQIIKPNSIVIFTTAFDKYAIDAFKYNGIDYLLKPFNIKELRQAINKIQLANKYERKTNHEQISNIIKGDSQFRKRFLVNKGDELSILNTDDINYIMVDQKNIFAYTDEGRAYKLNSSMDVLEKTFDNNKFFRVSRKYIANIKAIKKLVLFFNSKLIVKIKGCPDDNIIISNDRVKALKEWLDK